MHRHHPACSPRTGTGAADTLYNNGVQAYFRGSSAEAETSFSSLIGVDPKDPRAYYFRALSLVAQGRTAEARTDMQVGAQMEARMPNRYDIGKTLERSPGHNTAHARAISQSRPPGGRHEPADRRGKVAR